MKNTCAMLVSATLLPTVAFAQETTASNSKPTSDAAPLAFCSVEPVTFSSQALMPKGHVKVEANRTEIIQDTVALFSGNVDITSDTAVISASQAQINGSGRDLIAKGDVTYQDSQLKVESDAVTLRSEEERLEMQNTRYQLTGFVGQGAAKDIVLDTDTGIVLKEVSFTTCPEGDEEKKK